MLRRTNRQPNRPAGEGGRGGVAFAIQPHREVRPESGLSIYEIYDMKACRITTLFSGRGGEEEEDKGEKGVLLYSGKARHTITRRLKRTVGVRIYPLTLAMVLA